MSLTEVQVTVEVWLTCVTHALSTETEEIMGLLFGDVEYLENGLVIAHVWAAAPQTRSDRRKDRVETNPEQLAAATAEAELLTASTGRTTRVIGWYHSHPHITVLPSHVDVRTQAMYQLLDQGFVGLIFSCFSEDATKTGRIQATAFQSTDGRQRARPPSPVPTQQWAPPPAPQLAPIGRGPSPGSTSAGSDEFRPATSANLRSGSAQAEEFVPAGSSGSKGEVPAGSYLGALRGSSVDVDSPNMQEAMLRSNLDLSGAEFQRKEVPLHIVSGAAFPSGDFALSPLVALQRILFTEERTAFHQAMEQTARGGRIHPLAAVHHSATYQASLCKLMEYCLAPVISALWDRNQHNKLKLEALQQEAARLEDARRAAATTGSGRGGGSGSEPIRRTARSGPDPSSHPRTDPYSAPQRSTGGSTGLEALDPSVRMRPSGTSSRTQGLEALGQGTGQSRPATARAASPVPMPGWPTTGTSWPREGSGTPARSAERPDKHVPSGRKDEGSGSQEQLEKLVNLG